MQQLPRYVDLSGVPDWAKHEILTLAGEVQAAHAAAATERARAANSTRRAGLVALVAALVAGFVGYWRGRARRPSKVTVRSRVEASR